MSASLIESLLEQAAHLPRRARAELAQHLIESLDDSSEPIVDVAEAWIAEAQARWAAIERGEAQTYSAAEVLNEARELLK